MMQHNHAITTGSGTRCAFVAPRFTAGYSERWPLSEIIDIPKETVIFVKGRNDENT